MNKIKIAFVLLGICIVIGSSITDYEYKYSMKDCIKSGWLPAEGCYLNATYNIGDNAKTIINSDCMKQVCYKYKEENEND